MEVRDNERVPDPEGGSVRDRLEVHASRKGRAPLTLARSARDPDRFRLAKGLCVGPVRGRHDRPRAASLPDRALDLVKAARIVGASVVAIATEGDREIEQDATMVLSVPRVDELLSPFVNIIPLYLYAYHSSVKRGHNPDLLRYLDPTYWGARQIVIPPGTP